MNRKPAAFTLIELLIVVAIIAILAAIAVPNFLEAQTRAKVSRVKSDARALATAIESYAVDNNSAPLGSWHIQALTGAFPNEVDVLARLSSPVAYMTNPLVKDPFALKAGTIIAPGVVQAEQYGVYRYDSTEPLSLLPDASLTWNHHRAAAKNYSWWLYSYGPSRDAQSSAGAYRMYAEYIIGASWHPLDIYDPTNGTVSHGMIIRTNKGEYTGQDYGPL